MIKLNTAVRVIGDTTVPDTFQTKAQPRGVVKGMGWVVKEDGSILPLYIVVLDAGFYNDRGGYISHLCVHVDNLVVLD